jgi:hypothetical protein
MELDSVSKFFKRSTHIDLEKPKIRESSEVKDAAWYSNSTIFINQEYNPEGLSTEERVAHEFLHYVQDSLFWKRISKPLSRSKREAVGEFFEGSAFLFAAWYVNRGIRDQRENIMIYMDKKEHSTKSGVGNRQVLKVLRVSRSVSKAICDSLRYNYVVKTCASSHTG